KNPSYRKAKKKLQKDYLIPWYNPGFFNKHEIFEYLKQNKDANPYLPETEVFTSIDQLKAMLNRWKNIYLKPMNG
ncbi:YheC/YheD family protein, partial [Bacillus smithii]|nr:YheC/YheD family protein [Bacillus smithii]